MANYFSKEGGECLLGDEWATRSTVSVHEVIANFAKFKWKMLGIEFVILLFEYHLLVNCEPPIYLWKESLFQGIFFNHSEYSFGMVFG